MNISNVDSTVKSNEQQLDNASYIVSEQPYTNIVLRDAIIEFLDMHPDNTPLHIILK